MKKPGCDTSFIASPNLRVSTHSTGMILMDVKTGLIYSTNTVGAKLWAMIAEGQSLDLAARMLTREYGISPELAVDHCLSFCAELRKRAIVTPAPEETL